MAGLVKHREIEWPRCIPVAWNPIQRTAKVAEVRDNLVYDEEFYTYLSVLSARANASWHGSLSQMRGISIYLFAGDRVITRWIFIRFDTWARSTRSCKICIQLMEIRVIRNQIKKRLTKFQHFTLTCDYLAATVKIACEKMLVSWNWAPIVNSDHHWYL